MAARRYPIGIQTFSEIIGSGYLYIDKTEYVYRLTHGNGKYFCLSRPRRFGKSPLTTTIVSMARMLYKGDMDGTLRLMQSFLAALTACCVCLVQPPKAFKARYVVFLDAELLHPVARVDCL